MKTYLLDLDGTMYRGSAIIEEARLLIEQLHAQGHPYYFLTNNATRTLQENCMHMRNMGYEHIEESMFFTSAMAAAFYARKHYSGNRAAIIGMDGLKEALTKAGYELVDTNADLLFVGLDRHADYETYSHALSLLKQGAQLIGTNRDRFLPKADGFDMGNGAVVAMLEYASGQQSPEIGKPYPVILKEALEYFGLDKNEVILVGDNLETDILLAKTQQIESVLVTTGVHDETDCERLSIYPDRIVHSLLELL